MPPLALTIAYYRESDITILNKNKMSSLAPLALKMCLLLREFGIIISLQKERLIFTEKIQLKLAKFD